MKEPENGVIVVKGGKVMAEPKTRFKIGRKIYIVGENGTYREVRG